jgi:hypothetical protein
MNRSVILSLLLFLVFRSEIIHAQFSPNYDKKKNWNGLAMLSLKGNVKSLKQTCYLAIDSSRIIKKGVRKTKRDQISVNSDCWIEFDSKGRIVKESYYNLLGGGDEILNHEYDDANRIEKITGAPGPKGEIYFTYIYKYDAKGRISENSMSQLLGPGSYFENKSTFIYEENNIAERNDFKSDKNILTKNKSIYKYKNIGNETTLEYYNEKGGLCYKTSNKRDDKGNIIESIYYTADCKSIEHILKFKHDDFGNEIQKEYYTTDTKPIKIWSYKYEYDKQNNWIKRIDYENGKAIYMLERDLKYY